MSLGQQEFNNSKMGIQQHIFPFVYDVINKIKCVRACKIGF